MNDGINDSLHFNTQIPQIYENGHYAPGFTVPYDLTVPKTFEQNEHLGINYVQIFPLNLSVGQRSTTKEHNCSNSFEEPIDYSVPKPQSSEINYPRVTKRSSSDPLTMRSFTYKKLQDQPFLNTSQMGIMERCSPDSYQEVQEKYTSKVGSTVKNNLVRNQNSLDIKRFSMDPLKKNRLGNENPTTKSEIKQQVPETNFSEDETLLSAHRSLLRQYQLILKNQPNLQTVQREHSPLPPTPKCNNTCCKSVNRLLNYNKTIFDKYRKMSSSSKQDIKKYEKLKAIASLRELYLQRNKCEKCCFSTSRAATKDRKVKAALKTLSQNGTSRKIPESRRTSRIGVDNSYADGRNPATRNEEDHSYSKKSFPVLVEKPFSEKRIENNFKNLLKRRSSAKKQYKRCSLCLNHDVTTRMRGHIGNCQYQFCKCGRCLITKARQLHMLRQQRLTRQILKEKRK